MGEMVALLTVNLVPVSIQARLIILHRRLILRLHELLLSSREMSLGLPLEIYLGRLLARLEGCLLLHLGPNTESTLECICTG